MKVKIDKRNKGKFFHKVPRIGATKTKSQALKDISKYCQEHDCYYSMKLVIIGYESDILKFIKNTNEGFNFDL